MHGERRSIRWDLTIAIATFALALLGYLHPVDPTHPVRLDFLSKAITLPLWLLGISVLAIVYGTVVAVGLLRKPSAEIVQLKKELAAVNVKLLNKKPDYGIAQGTMTRQSDRPPEPKANPVSVYPSPLETLDDQLRKQYDATTNIVPALRRRSFSSISSRC